MEENIENKELTTKEKILQIKKEHPDWSYDKISTLLDISISTISYYLNPQGKINNRKRTARNRKNNPLNHKIFHFTSYQAKESLRLRKKSFNRIDNGRKKTNGNKFKIKDLLEKIGTEPKCYLTGRAINLNNSSEYNLDHRVPVSRGGDNFLENCELACKQANQAKSDLTPEEFFQLCKEVLEYNGYIVTKKEAVGLDGTAPSFQS